MIGDLGQYFTPPTPVTTDAAADIPSLQNDLSTALEGNSHGRPQNALRTQRISHTVFTVTPRLCKDWCSCTCHIRRRFGTPSLLNSFIGRLFIGYSGNFIGGRRCSEPGCAAYGSESSLKAEVKYYFPSWFFTKVLVAHFSSTRAQPTISIRMRNIIPLNSQFYFTVQHGNIPELKRMFEQRLAHPNDIGGLYGDSPLHVSLFLCILPSLY